MNSYNHPYHFAQQTPGPPQPSWQQPPRRQGWADPRLQQRPVSPVSPYNPPATAFGQPLPPPPPHPPATGQAPPFDTSQWGVRYNQAQFAPPPESSAEHRPPVPPRPLSSVGHLNPPPDQASAPVYPPPPHVASANSHGVPPAPPPQPPQPHPHSHPHPPLPQYAPGWNGAYQPGPPPPHTSSFSAPPPPPPPPRPAEYQAHVQGPYDRINVPHQEYSQRPPTQHYDPRLQGTWNVPTPTGVPTVYPPPTEPPSQNVSARVDGPLVSPIESSNGYWAPQPGSTATPSADYGALPKMDDRIAFSQALAFGGPSDWEHYETGALTPDQPSSSPPKPATAALITQPGPSSPPAAPAETVSPPPEPPTAPQPMSPVEIGSQSPSMPRTEATMPMPDHAPDRVDVRHPSPERPSSSARHHSIGSVRSNSVSLGVGVGAPGHIDSVIQAWNSPLKGLPGPGLGQDHSSRPDSRASNIVTSPDQSPVVRVVDPYEDLEPEFKGSLKRFVAMLRKESTAATDEDKFDVFQAFVKKELRLRSLLYGVELTADKTDAKPPTQVPQAPAPAQPAVAPPTLASRDVAKPADTTAIKVGPTVEPEPAQVAQTPSCPPEPRPPVQSQPKPTQQPTVHTKDVAPVLTQDILPVAAKDITPVVVKDPPPVLPISTPSARQPEAPKQEPIARAFPTPPSPPRGLESSGGARPQLKLDSASSADNDEESYSPGGRPMTSKPPSFHPPTMAARIAPPPPPPLVTLPSPSNDAPMVIEDYMMPNPASPSANAPILVISEPPKFAPADAAAAAAAPSVPLKFEPARPAYTPFRYNNKAIQAEQAKPLQPADQAYSSLRHSVVESGRLMAQDAVTPPSRPSSSSGKREHDEAFIGLIRKQSMAVRQKTPGAPGSIRPRDGMIKAEPPPAMRVGTPAVTAAPVATNVDSLRQAVAALRELLPRTLATAGPQHPRLRQVKSKMDSVPDQFEFIHDLVLEWDRNNREVRKQQEAERQARQEESEAHFDALFNDNEIGYAEIGELEADFKLAEAERRYREDQAELEAFSAQVFTPVTTRMQREIAELLPAYTMALELVESGSAPQSRSFKGGGERAPLGEALASVLALFGKMELRHRKVAEAHVERERRRKHLELTVLYINGDTAGVKKLEKDFTLAEKAQVLHEARVKDSRANKLMDVVDRATVPALGDNQTYIDDMLAKLHGVQQALGADAHPDSVFGPDGARDTLALARDVAGAIMDDSRRLLALSNEADMILNDSDYGVSVAEARAGNANKETYGKLETEKAKEDAKLADETQRRISSVTKGPEDAMERIREVLDRLGEDPDHQQRLKKALEKAKQRNAAHDTMVP